MGDVTAGGKSPFLRIRFARADTQMLNSMDKRGWLAVDTIGV
jgi:hypothetical protein